MKKEYVSLIFVVLIMVSCKPGVEIVLDAVKAQDEQEIGSLLERGASVEDESLSVQPLALAAYHRNINICKMLLEHGANPKVDIEKGKPALALVAQNEDIEIFKLFLDYGGAVDFTLKDGSSALIWTIINTKEIGYVEKILPEIEDINYTDEDGYSAICAAILIENFEILKYLVDNGAIISDIEKGEFDPLLYALSNGKYESVEHLIKLGILSHLEIIDEDYIVSVWEEYATDWIEDHIYIGDLLLDNGLPFPSKTLPYHLFREQERIASMNLKVGNESDYSVKFDVLYKKLDWFLSNGLNPNLIEPNFNSSLLYAANSTFKDVGGVGFETNEILKTLQEKNRILLEKHGAKSIGPASSK